ncbi:probable helicase senataxin isoform X2 [Rhopilema esculentum]|uniref:probable helicase senataxin isoform X2 n=1 Tax=Rhopilema esculentum TaxID=499914 RepID=UPI0031D6C934
MSCYWCKDEDVARSLLLQLSKPEQNGKESWKYEASLDLCYCTPCVREYHRLKAEFIKKYPSHEKILYQVEVERLHNHFLDTLKKDMQSHSFDLAYDFEDFLKVPVFEMLQYPYLLFNEDLMKVFTDCIVLLVENEKFIEIDEHLPGVYLLLLNPRLEVRKWALQSANKLGTVSIEDFNELSPVINCILKVVLYGLMDQSDFNTDDIPTTSITEKTNPAPHLYFPLSKKSLWLGLGAIFNSLDEHVLRMVLNVKGNSQVLGILKGLLESEEEDAIAAFWPLLFCLKILMQKLESTFWFLMNLDDAPRTTFRLVLKHPRNRAYLKSLAVKKISTSENPSVGNDSSFEEIALSQLIDDREDVSRHFNPFFWIQPYIVAVLDFEYIADIVTQEVVSYFVLLVEKSEWFLSHDFPTMLDVTVLKCLFSLIKYLVDKNLLCLIKGVSCNWLQILRHLRFEGSDFAAKIQSKSWNRISMKSHTILVSLLSQGEAFAEYRSRKDYEKLLDWVKCQKLGHSSDPDMVEKLMQYLQRILKHLTEISNPSLSALSIRDDQGRLFSASSEDNMKTSAGSCKSVEDRSDSPKPGCSNEPIYISDSDEDVVAKETTSYPHSSPEKSVFEPISYIDDLDYSECEEEKRDDEIDEADDFFVHRVFKLPLKKSYTGKQDNASSDDENMEGQIDGEKPWQGDTKPRHSKLAMSPLRNVDQIPVTFATSRTSNDGKEQKRSHADSFSSRTVMAELITLTDSESDAKSPVLKMKTPVRYTYGKAANHVRNLGSSLTVEEENVSESRTAKDKSLFGSNKSLLDSVADKSSENRVGLSEQRMVKEENHDYDQYEEQGSVNSDNKCAKVAVNERDDLAFLQSLEVVDSSSRYNAFVKHKEIKKETSNLLPEISTETVTVKREEESEDKAEDNSSRGLITGPMSLEVSTAKEIPNPQPPKHRSPFESRGAFEFLTGLRKMEITGDHPGDGNHNDVEFSASEQLESPLDAEQDEDLKLESQLKETDQAVENTNEEVSNEEGRETENINLSNEVFQKRKSILYEQFVKKKELLALEKRNEASKGAAASAHASDVEAEHEETVTKNDQRAPQEHLPDVKKSKVYKIDHLLRYILAWHPVWLGNEQEDELSIMLPCEPRTITNRYQSYDDYMMTMWPLVLIEFFAQMIRDYKERDKQPLDYKFKSFEPNVNSQNFRIVNCGCLREKDSSTRKEPNEYDLVILRGGDEYITETFGVVEEVEKTSLRDDEDDSGSFSFTLVSLKIKVANLQPSVRMSSVQIEVVTSMVSLYRRWEALLGIRRSLLAPDILNPFRKQVFEISANNTASDELGLTYNPGQASAIATITSAITEAYPLPKVRLLQGPPGTGKTHTLLGLIKNILKSLAKNEENPRILVCTPSNAAIDSLLVRLLEDPPRLEQNSSTRYKKHAHSNCGDFNLLRVGDSRQMNHTVARYSLENLIEIELKKQKKLSDPAIIKEELHRTLQKLKVLDKECTKLKMAMDRTKNAELKKKLAERERQQKCSEYLQRKLKNAGQRKDPRLVERESRAYFLKNAHIICCTLSGAGSKHMVKAFRTDNDMRVAPFACVIIDEAGQCCEPDALIPMQYGASKLVLVGDPAQLPATILSQRASRYGYGQSLFERIHRALIEHSESPVLSLQEQYRMHPAICAFPSKKFYQGNLITAREVVQRRILPGIKSFIVLNISDSEETREAEGAIHNPEERKYVTYISKEIIKKGIVLPEKVGVITPYRKQLQKLQSEMSIGQESKIEINTIDGFQGREKDIIILSCVRAQKVRTGVGFLQDPQRMNVALTRAKHSLIVLIHSDSLQVDEDWKDMIDFARSRGLFFNISSFDQIETAVFSSVTANERLEGSNKSKTPGSNLEENRLEFDAASTPLQYEDLSDEDVSDKLPHNNEPNREVTKVADPRIRTKADAAHRGRSPGASNDSRPRLMSQTSRDPDSDSLGKRSHIRHEVRFPHRHSDGTDCKDKCLKGVSSPKDGEMSGTQAEQARKNRCSKFPHKHSDGTECVDKCMKMAGGTSAKVSVSPGISPNAYASQVARYKKLPHTHSDGTECIKKCSKLRTKPSSSYFKLPHCHGDGTKCETSCKRLEEREKLRVAKEGPAQVGPVDEEGAQTSIQTGNLKSCNQGKQEAESSTSEVKMDVVSSTASDSVPTTVLQQVSTANMTKSIAKSALSKQEDHNRETETEKVQELCLSPEDFSADSNQPALASQNNRNGDANEKAPSSKTEKKGEADSESLENEVTTGKPAPTETSADVNAPPPLPPTQQPAKENLPPLPPSDDGSNDQETPMEICFGDSKNGINFIDESNNVQNELRLRAALYAKRNNCIETQNQVSQGYAGYNSYVQWSANNQTGTVHDNGYYTQNMQGVQGNQYAIQNVQQGTYLQNQFQQQGGPKTGNSFAPLSNTYTQAYSDGGEPNPNTSYDAASLDVPIVFTNGEDVKKGQSTTIWNTHNKGSVVQRNGEKGFHADHGQSMYGSEVPQHVIDQSHGRADGFAKRRTMQNIDDEIHRIRVSTDGVRKQTFDADFVVVAEKRKNMEKAKRDQNEESLFVQGSNSRQPGGKTIPEGFFGSAMTKKPNRQPFLGADSKLQNSADDMNNFSQNFSRKREASQFQNNNAFSGVGPNAKKQRKMPVNKFYRHVQIAEKNHANGVNRDQGMVNTNSPLFNERKNWKTGLENLEDMNEQNGRSTIQQKDGSLDAKDAGVTTFSKFKLRDFRISLERTDSFEHLQSRNVTEISPDPAKRIVRTLGNNDREHQPNLTKVEEITKRIKERNASRHRTTQLVERQDRQNMMQGRTYFHRNKFKRRNNMI